VTAGLQPGDKLIIAGHRFVAPGQKVNIVSQTDPKRQTTGLGAQEK
jgi:hypothetical protein